MNFCVCAFFLTYMFDTKIANRLMFLFFHERLADLSGPWAGARQACSLMCRKIWHPPGGVGVAPIKPILTQQTYFRRCNQEATLCVQYFIRHSAENVSVFPVTHSKTCLFTSLKVVQLCCSISHYKENNKVCCHVIKYNNCLSVSRIQRQDKYSVEENIHNH